MWAGPWCSAPNNLPLQPTTKEIFDPTLQLEFIPAKPTPDSTFFIIFTNTEKISSKLIHFFLKEFISLWISLIQFLSSLLLEAQIFSKLIARYSSIHIFQKVQQSLVEDITPPAQDLHDLSLHHSS